MSEGGHTVLTGFPEIRVLLGDCVQDTPDHISQPGTLHATLFTHARPSRVALLLMPDPPISEREHTQAPS